MGDQNNDFFEPLRSIESEMSDAAEEVLSFGKGMEQIAGHLLERSVLTYKAKKLMTWFESLKKTRPFQASSVSRFQQIAHADPLGNVYDVYDNIV